jgi:glycosyltransferase involved in cell wall biosynthesis
MNILYLCGSYGLDLDKMLGPKIHVQSILKGLQEQGHKAILLAVQQKNQLIDNEYKNIKHYIIKHKAARFYIHKIIPYTGFLNSFRVFIKILTLNKIYHFDVIHERYTSRSWGGIWASKILRIPLILEMNGPGIEEKQIQGVTTKASKKWVSNAHQKYILTNCNKLILASGAIRNFIREKSGVKLPYSYVLINGADIPSKISPLKKKNLKEKYHLNNSIVILYSGSLYKWYGSLNMIKAFCTVAKEMKNVKFIVIGSGDNLNELKKYVLSKELHENITFYNPISKSELLKLIQVVDICAVYYKEPITYFGTSTKVTEYMAAGKIIVSTPHMYEIIKHKINGYISKSSDIQEYSNAMIYALNNKPQWQKISKNAQKLVTENYTWTKYCNKLKYIYNEAIFEKKN